MHDSEQKICLVGWGAIATTVHSLLAERGSGAQVVAVAVRYPERAHAPLPPGAQLLTDPSELAGVSCTLVVEAASREAAAVWGEAAISAGLDFVMGSPSALADPTVAARVMTAGAPGRGRLILPAGSLGGIGTLSSAARLPLSLVSHEIAKPPRAWIGTIAETLVDLVALTEPTVFFSGSAREAAKRYPSNANSVIVTALAGIGLDRTIVRLVADPALEVNEHRLEARGDFGHWSMALANAPLDGNPKSSAMTALNLVRVIENRSAGFVV